MKSSIVAKLEALYERHEEVQALLGDAATIADQDKFRALSREYAQLSDVARCYTDWRQVQEDIETAQMMLDDPEMREMAQEELRDAKEKGDQLEQQLQVLLLPKILMTSVTPSWKCAPGPAATKQRCLPAIYSACTPVTQNRAAGR
ncbi:peptide chain release factor 1 [Klebsiella pneumoniae]|uniref:Peptide chain release factor 1 n=1 Tax=Klebsiella pneumoniae TaxID=573 RepID=A0A378AY11_KLEPN|nr:peptide chain release factor 1 [Klebsiella pneumoniae]